MNWYYLKKKLLWPYILFKRRQERRQVGFIKAALELHYYRPAFYRFIGATIDNPDIMYDAPLTKGDIALDVGAFEGDWSARVYEKYQPCIYAFELDPPSIELLKKRFTETPDITCVPYGLAGQNATLALSQRGMGSTLHEQGHGNASRGAASTVDVEVRDIVDVLDSLGHVDIAIIKLNIEGAEYDVLERLIEAGQLSQIRCYTIQFHEWLDRAHLRRRRIRKELSKTHTLMWDYPFVWEQWVRK